MMMGKLAKFPLALAVGLLCVGIPLLRAEKLTEFAEPFQFPSFALDEERIYIWDDSCVVHIYGRKNFARLGQFGRKGQGPAEFQFISYVHVLSDRLCIGQGQKISYFSKSGEFLKTITNPNPDTGTYMPLGPNFVGTRYLPSDAKDIWITLSVGLYDSKFQPIREIYRGEIRKATVYNFAKEKKDVLVVRDCFKYETYNDRLYVGNTGAGFFMRVFNRGGESLYDINRDDKKRKITASDKKKTMEALRQAVGEQEFERRRTLVNEYIFPEFYPAFSDFSIADGKIYLFSYPVPGRPTVCTILDLQGRRLKEIEIPGIGIIRGSGSQAYRVHKGKYYYLLYDYDSDRWALHVETLE